MVTATKGGAKLFSAQILEDALLYAENHQEEFNEFIASTCVESQKLRGIKNDEILYKRQFAVQQFKNPTLERGAV